MKPNSRILLGCAMLALSSATAVAADAIYIPLGSANAIISIDPNRDVVVGRIEGVPAAHGLAATPDGQYLIVGSYNERPASAAAPSKPTVVSEEEHASHHAKEPETAKKTSSVLSTVSVVRIEDKSVIRRIDVPGAVHHVTVSPNGRLAVVTQPNQDAISVIDLASYRVIKTLPTGPLPNYAVFSPDNGRLYVSNAGNDTVSDIDVSRWIVRRNIVVGESPEHVVLSRNGERLYVNNINGGSVSVIETATDSVLKTLKIGSALHGLDLSSDDQTLFVAALGDNKLVAVDLRTGGIRTIPLVPEPYHLAAIGNRGNIYVSSASDPKIWVIDPKSLALIREIQIGGKGHQMTRAAGG